jgi:predicted DsbA family dithiol-disulfide isomerase
MMNHLRQTARALGLPFGDRSMTYNSRLAQEMGKWAESKGKGDEFHTAMFRAYFVDGQNIGKVPVIVKVAESIHLNIKDAQKIIENRTYKDAVDLDWKRSFRLNVTAVPTFLFNHQSMVGAQPYKTLENLLLSNHVKRRNHGAK